MKYCKLINDREIELLTESFIVLNGTVYANPSPLRLKESGYKTLICENEPEYDRNTETLERIYTQTQDSVIESYVIRKKE